MFLPKKPPWLPWSTFTTRLPATIEKVHCHLRLAYISTTVIIFDTIKVYQVNSGQYVSMFLKVNLSNQCGLSRDDLKLTECYIQTFYVKSQFVWTKDMRLTFYFYMHFQRWLDFFKEGWGKMVWNLVAAINYDAPFLCVMVMTAFRWAFSCLTMIRHQHELSTCPGNLASWVCVRVGIKSSFLGWSWQNGNTHESKGMQQMTS